MQRARNNDRGGTQSSGNLSALGPASSCLEQFRISDMTTSPSDSAGSRIPATLGIGLTALAIAGATGLAVWAGTSRGTAAPTPVERGSYLVNSILACGNCHTPTGPTGPVPGKELSGGIRFDTPAFDVTASNISQDKKAGIGAWSDAEIKAAIVDGVRPDGSHLAPIMPSAFYKALSPADLDAVVAYLRTVKPQPDRTPQPSYKVAFHAEVIPGAEKPIGEAERKDPLRHGFYLATIGHCMECHTPRGPQGLDFAKAGKGGTEFPGPWGVSVSRNITSSKTKGIGAWSDAEIKRAITQAKSRDGSPLKPPMDYGRYGKMSGPDLDALVAWLRTVPPQE
jgi:mono/diheme cytochrome c family protein